MKLEFIDAAILSLNQLKLHLKLCFFTDQIIKFIGIIKRPHIFKGRSVPSETQFILSNIGYSNTSLRV